MQEGGDLDVFIKYINDLISNVRDELKREISRTYSKLMDHIEDRVSV